MDWQLQAHWSPAQAVKTILWKELFAIVNAVNTWGHHWAKQRILFHEDDEEKKRRRRRRRRKRRRMRRRKKRKEENGDFQPYHKFQQNVES